MGRYIPVIIFIGLAYFFWRGLSLEPHVLQSVQLGRALPAFSIPVLGKENTLFTPAQLRGRPYLLNVWASWCESCQEEQVFLLELARRGIPIYGLNYKDNRNDALKWLHEWGNPFRMIGADRAGKVGIDLGVYGAPETFLIDAQGVIRQRHVGVLDQQSWEKEFLPRMKNEN